MPRVSYVNGRYLPHARAAVHIEDRGYQFADGVYEVIAVAAGHPVDLQPHLARLDRSLAEIRLARPVSPRALNIILAQMVRRNRVDWGMIYIQMTRGVAPRAHVFPSGVTTSLIVTARAMTIGEGWPTNTGARIITRPDIRWKRCDIKSVSLLSNVLLKQEAQAENALEAWMVDAEGMITEGTASSAWMVDEKEVLITRGPGVSVLASITRQTVIKLARAVGLAVEERAFTVEQAKSAGEAFYTSTTSFVVPVIEIDGTPIGGGKTGAKTRQVMDLYRCHLEKPGTRR